MRGNVTLDTSRIIRDLTSRTVASTASDWWANTPTMEYTLRYEPTEPPNIRSDGQIPLGYTISTGNLEAYSTIQCRKRERDDSLEVSWIGHSPHARISGNLLEDADPDQVIPWLMSTPERYSVGDVVNFAGLWIQLDEYQPYSEAWVVSRWLGENVEG
jgi:hypothetical protein